MGLDQWCYACDSNAIPDIRVDFQIPDDAEEIAYWRKHPNIHGWMDDLYRSRGGSDPNFNTSTVELTIDDLEQLQQDIINRKLPHTAGFFFGKSDGSVDERKYDLDFVSRAIRLIIDQDKRIFYTSWW